PRPDPGPLSGAAPPPGAGPPAAASPAVRSPSPRRARARAAGPQPAQPPPQALPGPSMWRPVRGGNAFEITVSRLAQAIRLGLVSAGERLPPERELADRLRVSRVTLRQAIGALREAGYLESRRGRSGGTFVVYAVPPAADRSGAALLAREMGAELPDALDLRWVLESGAAALAATRALSAG